MADWTVSDNEIQEIERLLLPKGCHFADDAKTVIRCWQSKDVAACPGSGKTTVLLAKLKLLADKMPLDKGAGICVLSHTNVAVDVLKDKLSKYSTKLMSYPNFIGTIQSFMDRFVTMPYVRKKYKRNVQPVDEQTFAEHFSRIISTNKYSELKYFLQFTHSRYYNLYSDWINFIKNLYLNDDGNLSLYGVNRMLARSNTDSATQFYYAEKAVLVTDGIMRYKDAYDHAKEAIDSLSSEYTELFSSRFQYVFVDEFQDCNKVQRDALDKLFNPSLCCVIHIGDPDQAIYNFSWDEKLDWIPGEHHLVIKSSCRYPQEIADILTPLKSNRKIINSVTGNCKYKPVLIIYDSKTILNVLDQFVNQLVLKGIHDTKGIYKAVGFVGKNSDSGLRIASYWDNYDYIANKINDFRYWSIINDICQALKKGQLYRTEYYVRKLICRIFYYAKIKNNDSNKEYTLNSIQEQLHKDYKDVYIEFILKFSQLKEINKETVEAVFREMMVGLLQVKNRDNTNIIAKLPEFFMEQETEYEKRNIDKNVHFDFKTGFKIQFCTIHSIKGQTHDATLYLETNYKNGSDLCRILFCYGVGQSGRSDLYDYSRKLAYVGFSRPSKLLCIAMKESTYERCKESTLVDKCEVVDIRQ